MRKLPMRSELWMLDLHLQNTVLMRTTFDKDGASQDAHLSPFESEMPLVQLLALRKTFLGFLRRRLPDTGTAEDILQTGYIRALEHRDQLTSTESATAWFYRLLRNAVIDNYRRQTAKDKALEAWAKELENAPQPAIAMQDAICACLNEAVAGLKPEYAEILRAVDLGEQKPQDFAQQHKLSVSNVGVRSHRARAALRRSLVRACGACAEHGCLDCTCKKALTKAKGKTSRYSSVLITRLPGS